MTRRSLLRRMSAAATVAVVALAAVQAAAGSGGTHHVAFDVANATGLIPGMQVRAAGQPVGAIDRVDVLDGGRSARVVLTLSDGRVWPLPPDTGVRIRFGGTIAANGRYIELDRGTSPAAPIPDGGRIARVDRPVEFDELFDTFGPRTRQNLRATVDASGRTLAPAARPLHRALASAPAAVHELRGVLGDLGDDHLALDTLVRSTDRVLAATDAADPGLGPLLADGATTFTAIGDRARTVEATLAQAPATLRRTRAALGQADRTLTAATALSRRLRPGVDELVALLPPLDGTLRTVRDVAPAAHRALATTRRASPDLVRMLDRTRALAPTLDVTLRAAATQLRCLRPYAPEIGGFFGTWTGFVADGDKKDKYARLFNAVYPFPNDTPLTVPQMAKLLPGPFASFGLPRAPGANVDQPWYQPACGITADGANPARDPEAMNFDLFKKNPVEVAP